MLTKISEKALFLSLFIALSAFSGTALRAQCAAPPNLSIDSTTLTQVHISWTAPVGVTQFEVDYVTPSDTFNVTVMGTSVSFPLPADTSFQLVSVTSICPSSGLKGGGITVTHGAIVITIVDIFKKTSGCDSTGFEDSWVFIEDLCKYCYLSDLCDLIKAIGPRSNFGSEQEWEDSLRNEITNHGEQYGIKSLKHGFGCFDDKASGNPPPGVRIAGNQEIVSIAPNPFSTAFTISLTATQGEHITITMLDATGRSLAQQQIEAQATGTQKINHLGQGLPQGMYMISIRQNGSTRSYRVIKR